MGDLCTACMCSGRNLFFIGETGFYQIYLQILNEIQVTDASLLYTRVCWECLALLRNWQKFKQQVKDSYTQLQYVQQNNFIQLPREPPRLQIEQVYNISYPHIKTETEESQTQQEDDREECIKSEEMHCEPATFVNNLKVELKKKKRESKKVDKPIKEKTKKRLKTKPEKVALKKKIKVKIKHSPSLDSVQDDHLDDDDDIASYDDDEVKGIEIDRVQKEEIAKVLKKEDTFEDEAVRLNGELETLIPSAGGKEVLPERPQCAECGKNFSSRKTYRYHLNVLHKGQNRYPCPRCGKVYQWKSNLGRHLRSHKARDSGELYCETCDKRFASVATYRQHLRVSRRHVPESEFSFMCNDCGKKFVNKTRLRDHIDWEHLKKIKFRCQLCNKPFKCHTSLYVHMQNVHRNKEKKDNLCHVCGKSYQNAAKLKYHIVAMHTSETPYQCQQCTAAFGWYSSLYRHVREVHYKMKVQPKKSKKSKKMDLLPPLLPQQVVLGQIHQPGPP